MTNAMRPLQRASRTGSVDTVVEQPLLSAGARADVLATQKMWEELRWLTYAANPFMEKADGPPASPFGGGLTREPAAQIRATITNGDVATPAQMAEIKRRENYLALLDTLEQNVKDAMKYTGNLTPIEAQKMLERIRQLREQ